MQCHLTVKYVYDWSVVVNTGESSPETSSACDQLMRCVCRTADNLHSSLHCVHCVDLTLRRQMYVLTHTAKRYNLCR